MIASRTMQRANTIPEMALVLSLVMLTLFGVFQYALVGFNQIGADGAAFVGDHAAVAEYGGPSTANVTYAQQVGVKNFPHTNATFNSSIPKNGTYEVDVTATHAAIGGMAQLFPSTVSQRARIVEPSQSQALSTAPPTGQCATGAEKITYDGTTLLNNTAVGLLGNVPADKIYSLNTASGALQFNVNALASEDSIVGNVSTNFTATVASLAQVSNALQTIAAVPLVGSTVATTLQTTIQSQIAPLVNSAVGGVYVAPTSSGVTAGITQATPLSPTAFAAQVTATTNAVNTIESSNKLNSILTGLFTTTLNPVLYGSGTTPGLLTNLTALNTAQTALNNLDTAAAPCV